MTQEVIVDISPEGEIEISVNGVKGQSCTDITKNLEKALGVEGQRTLTNEYYEKNDSHKERNRA